MLMTALCSALDQHFLVNMRSGVPPRRQSCLTWAIFALLLHQFITHGYCLSQVIASTRNCPTTPLFVFGASMVDVGENTHALPLRSSPEFAPYGNDYFSKPSRRFSNGRLIVDFITQGLGNGLIHPYMQSVGPDFRCGVNFASSGSTARNRTITSDGTSSLGMFSFSVQVDQFEQFKRNVLAALNDSSLEDSRLPSEQDFIDGVYLIETGHNDYGDFVTLYEDYNVTGNVSATLGAMELELKRLHAHGAMHIAVMNLIPLGCTPERMAVRNPPVEEQDEYGCWAALNNLIEVHNAGLEILLQNLSNELPSANWTLFDAHSVFMDAIRHPENYGIKHYRRACCGAGGGEYNYNADVLCGQSGYIDGVLTRAWRCEDPSIYIFWDTIHPVESFAKYVANAFLTGEHLRTFCRVGISMAPNLLK